MNELERMELEDEKIGIIDIVAFIGCIVYLVLVYGWT